MRIIPALAGNTEDLLEAAYGKTDHPRSRGEYSVQIALEAGYRGSSPLSRGILSNEIGGVAPRGIIPALAGNTAASC